MDVTHLNEFGKLKYIHVTTDTFSGFIFASLEAGEASENVIAHTMQSKLIMVQDTLDKTSSHLANTFI